MLAPEEEAFRSEVVEFLAGHGPVDGFFFHEAEHDTAVRALYRALGERGWLSLSWPVEAGGRALPPVYEFVLWDEMAYARAARPPLGSGIVAKTIIRYGTDEQRQRFLPGLRAGTTFFSLGYSEPEAGSDLAGVRTRAVRRRRPLRTDRREALDLGRPSRRLPVGAVPHRHAREPLARVDPAHRRSARPAASRSRRSRRSTASGSTRCGSTTWSSRSTTASAMRTEPGR